MHRSLITGVKRPRIEPTEDCTEVFYNKYILVFILSSLGAILSVSCSLTDGFNSGLFLEQTCLRSPSFSLLSYPNGSPCLVLKPYVNFYDPKGGTCNKSELY